MSTRDDDGSKWSAPGGIALSRAYFEERVDPLLKERLPDVAYAAARVGRGSDVLGLDDVMSRDHDWGLRLHLFVAEIDRIRVGDALDRHLPAEFRGHPVRFPYSADPVDRLRIDVLSVNGFAREHLGFDPRRKASVTDWLSLAGQSVLEVTSGEVFYDSAGGLTALRKSLTWYPDDLCATSSRATGSALTENFLRCSALGTGATTSAPV